MKLSHAGLASAHRKAFSALTEDAGAYEISCMIEIGPQPGGNRRTIVEGKTDFGDRNRRPAGHYVETYYLERNKPPVQVEVVWVGGDQIYARAVTPKNDGEWFASRHRYERMYPGLPQDAKDVHGNMTTLQRSNTFIDQYRSTFTKTDPSDMDNDINRDGTYIFEVDTSGRLLHSMITIGLPIPDDEPKPAHHIPYREPQTSTITHTAAHTSTPAEHGLDITGGIGPDGRWIGPLTVYDPDRGTRLTIDDVIAVRAVTAVEAAELYATHAMEQSPPHDNDPWFGSL
jgi:hypothetical protein